MPKTKLPFYRYLLIDRILRNKLKKYPTIQEILQECKDNFGVTSISSIEKDLSTMRVDFNAPILYHRKFRGYYYSDSNYKFSRVYLSSDDIQALKNTEHILEEFKTIPFFNEFSEAVDKVLDGLNLMEINKENLSNKKSFFQVERSSYIKTQVSLKELFQIIEKRIPIEIKYKKFNESYEKNYHIHPYLLKEFNSLWYLIGFEEKNQKIRTFAVDRLISYQKLNSKKFISERNANFDSDKFFKYCYGITALDQKPEKIILSFLATQGKYILLSPIHKSQKVLLNNESELRIELTLIFNHEILSKILSYGKNVRVIKPEKIAFKIAKELDATQKMYDYLN